MERPPHPRDLQAASMRSTTNVAAREAAAVMDSWTAPSSSGGLLKRGARIARSFLTRRECTSSQNLNTCEKPVSSTNTLLAALVAAGVVAFIIILIVLYMLHLRRTRRDETEFANDPHDAADYGLDEIPASKKTKGGQRSTNNLGVPEVQQNRMSAQQLMEAQNPFGYGAELADSDRVSNKEGSPPRYPGSAHVKM